MFRLPIDITNLGITNWWDFGTGQNGTNYNIVEDRIGSMPVESKGRAVTSKYTSAFSAAEVAWLYDYTNRLGNYV